MSAAWETSPDDVLTVLDAHGIEKTEEELEALCDGLDHDAIENGVLYFCNMEAQTDSMLEDIEQQLRDQGVIPADAPVKFKMRPEDEYEDDFDLDDEGDEDEENDDDEAEGDFGD